MSTKEILLYTRKEAEQYGVKFKNKLKNDILELIDSRTSLRRARNRDLLQYNDLLHQFQSRYKTDEITKMVLELEQDKLVLLFPGLVFSDTDKQIVTNINILSKPLAGAVEINTIFSEIIESCVDSLKHYLEVANFFDKEKFLKELGETLQEDVKSNIYHAQLYFEPEQYLNKTHMPIPLENDVVEMFKKMLADSIVSRNIGIPLQGKKIFLFSEKSILQIGDAISSFFYSRILAVNSEKSIVQRELELIELESEIYFEEKHPVPTFNFVARRAAAVKQYLQAEKYKGDTNYPEGTALLMAINLEKFVNECYEKEYLENLRNQMESIKNRLLMQSHDWQDSVLVLNDEQLEKYPPVILEKLKTDHDIEYTSWFMGKSKYHMFMGYQPKKINEIMKGMAELRGRETWKIMALRKLLNNCTRLSKHLNPFSSDSIYIHYASLFREAYSPYTPYLFSILFIFNIKSLNKVIFDKANKRLLEKQKQLKQKYAQATERKRQAFLKLIGKKKDDIKKLKTRNQILDELDLRYFHNNTIPLVKELHQKFTHMQESQFNSILNEFQFELISPDRSNNWKNSVLFYPKTMAWKNVVTRFKSNFGSAKNPSAVATEMAKGSPAAVERIKVLHDHIEHHSITKAL